MSDSDKLTVTMTVAQAESPASALAAVRDALAARTESLERAMFELCLPWHVSDMEPEKVLDSGGLFAATGYGNREARYIVRAVNSHHALVAVATSLLRWLNDGDAQSHELDALGDACKAALKLAGVADE